jgi:hypothetical protein
VRRRGLGGADAAIRCWRGPLGDTRADLCWRGPVPAAAPTGGDTSVVAGEPTAEDPTMSVDPSQVAG